MIGPERWERLKELFEAALELRPEERPSFIQRVCRDDEELLAQLTQLLADHEALGQFLCDPPAAPDYLLPSGASLSNRFRVIRPLGKGGIGEVYEAFDQDLREASALKILRPELAANTESVSRLVQEVQLARKVTHPNVCRLFDLNRDVWEGKEIVFLTMELLAGETLSERLRRGGPMSAADARDVADQIAAGIDAAHVAGIVHRDFKSANVMLVPAAAGATRAVVMDFGLARNLSASEEQHLTATGMVAGTVAYMAPEQLAGGPIGRAVDLYAFGVVLAEMRSGSVDLRRVRELDPDWRMAVERCIEREPSRRPPSAVEALRLMGQAPRGKGNKKVLVGVAVIFLLALLAVALRMVKWQGASHEGVKLMMAEIINSTGDPHMTGVGIELRRELVQSAYFDLWEDERRPTVMREMGKPATTPLSGAIAREAAMREGVPYVLFGTLASVGDGYSLDLRLEELEARTVFSGRHWDLSFSATSRTALHETIHDASRSVRTKIGENSRDLNERDRPPQDVTTTSWQSLALYGDAEQARARNAQDEAVTYLRRSVALDQHFALGYMRLGDLLLAMHQQGEGLRAWQAAVAEAGRMTLTRREELRINGLFASEVQDYGNAEIAFSQLEKEYPRDYLWSFYLGDSLRWQGRFSEATVKMESAARKNPASIPALSNLASTLLVGRLDGLDGVIRRLADRAPDLAAYDRGLQHFAAAEYADAIAALQSAAASSNPDRGNRANTALACVLAELGRYREARRTLEDGIAADQRAARTGARGDKLVMLAYLDLRQKQLDDLRTLCLEAVGVENSPQRIARAAILLARAGFLQEAGKLAQALTQFPPSPLISGAIARIRGEMALGRAASEAVKAFQTVDGLEPKIRIKDYLARGYAATGEYAKALAGFSRIADSPQFLWEAVDFDYPGILTDSLLDMAECAARVGDTAALNRALELYARRRGSADENVPGAAEARRRISNLQDHFTAPHKENHP